MFKGIIFDLDGTLVNTSALQQLRDNREWAKAIRSLPTTTIQTGIKNVLSTLKGIVEMGIVTSSPKRYAEKVVAFHDLEIQVISAYQDTRKHKPSPDPILHGIKFLNLDPEEVVVVGDSTVDIIATKAAGAYAIAVTWGDGQLSDLRNVSPNQIIDTPDALLELFVDRQPQVK